MRKDTMLRWRNRIAPRGSFTASVLTLATGTGVAQLIPLVSSPLLSRLYSPSDFGRFALFVAIVSILSVIASGRFEFAITLPKSDDEALHVSFLAILLTSAASLLCLILLLLFGKAFTRLSSLPLSGAALYLIPMGVFLTGVYQVLNLWLIRKQRFGRLALRRVLQFGAMALVQIVFGLVAMGSTGLILGYLVGQAIGYGFLAWQVWNECAAGILSLTLRGAMQQATRYRKFAFYSVPSSLCSTLTGQAPSFLLTSFFGAAVTGYYDLPKRLLAAPSVLLASSILDVFNERASRDFRAQGNCRAIYVKTLKLLLAMAVLPYSILFAFSPWLIPVLFGSQWVTAGEYARYLSLAAFAIFVASPLGYVLLIAERQFVNLIWQIASLVCGVATLCAGAYFHDPRLSIIGFSLSNVVLCGIFILLSYRASGPAKCPEHSARRRDGAP